jgi:hypothetical protein
MNPLKRTYEKVRYRGVVDPVYRPLDKIGSTAVPLLELLRNYF